MGSGTRGTEGSPLSFYLSGQWLVGVPPLCLGCAMAAACSCPPLRLPAGLCSRGSPAESPAEVLGIFLDAAWGSLLSPPPVVLPSDCAAAAPPSLPCAHPAGMRPPSTSRHPPHIRGGSAGAGGFGQPPCCPAAVQAWELYFPKQVDV